jgi:C-terminal processing protease CtpA/Prc
MIAFIIALLTMVFLILSALHPDLPVPFAVAMSGALVLVLSLVAIIWHENKNRKPHPLLPLSACLGCFWMISMFFFVVDTLCIAGIKGKELGDHMGVAGAILLGCRLFLRKIKRPVLAFRTDSGRTFSLPWKSGLTLIRNHAFRPFRFLLYRFWRVLKSALQYFVFMILCLQFSGIANSFFAGKFASDFLIEQLQCLRVPPKYAVAVAMKDRYLWPEEVRLQPVFLVRARDAGEVVEGMKSRHDRFSFTTDFFPFMAETGMGIHYGRKGADWYVSAVQDGSPAERAGIHRGFRLLSLNGQAVRGEDIPKMPEEERNQLRTFRFATPEGTVVNKKMASEQLKQQKPVSGFWGAGENAAMYIRFDEFGWMNKEAIPLFRKAQEQGVKRFIIDLRHNRGGSLFNMKNIASFLIGSRHKGALVIKSINRPKYAHLNDKFTVEESTYPGATEIVFLTTAMSASVSEDLIMAVRPYLKTVVIGENTCGKPYASRLLYYGWDNTFCLMDAIIENSRGERVPLSGIRPDIRVADDYSKEIGARDDPLLAAALKVLGV